MEKTSAQEAKKMTKIYYRKSGSAESDRYIEYPLEDAKKLIEQAFTEYRIVVNMGTNQRVFDVSKIADGDVLRVFPIVGGG